MSDEVRRRRAEAARRYRLRKRLKLPDNNLLSPEDEAELLELIEAEKLPIISVNGKMSQDIQIISVIGANGQPLPINGNSIGSNWNTEVKQERADEAEIAELAAKLVETQKAALAKQQQQAAQLASRQTLAANGLPAMVNTNGQTNILNYLQRQPNKNTAINLNGNATINTNQPQQQQQQQRNGDSSPDKKAITDEESQKGRFGWTTLAKVHIPYIYRGTEKYCSVRMIEMKLLGKYLNCLHPDIYSSCTCVRSYYISDAEARLLFEINNKHCDNEFGVAQFTPKDLVVRLSDATKFHQFLEICYRKLMSGSKSPSEKCGFIRINKESVVPYTVRNSEQVVPLFYFEGETENLKQKADYLSGWDLAYLKFCCKVQGIRNELFNSENVAVISLTDIKSYFPNGTEFEDYWPNKVVDSNLLIGNRSNVNNAVNWTRQPAQPPPKVLSAAPQSNQKAGGQTQHNNSAVAAAAAAAVAVQQQQQQQNNVVVQQQQQQQHMHKRGAVNANAATNAAFAAQSAAVAAAAAAAAMPGNRLHTNSALNQATVQALANGSWMSQQQQNNLQMSYAMLQAQAQQQAANARNAQYRNPMESLLLNSRQPPYGYNNPAMSMAGVNSHGQGNAPPPLIRSGSSSTNAAMSNVEQCRTMLQQEIPPLQRHNTQNTNTFNNNTNRCNNPSVNFHYPNSSAPTTPSPVANATANTGAAYNPFNFATNGADFAFWHQLTPAQRLLLTQQIKNAGSQLNAAAVAAAAAALAASTKCTLPPIPSLPLDTDLKTMLDYNPHRNSHEVGNLVANSAAKMSKSAGGTNVNSSDAKRSNNTNVNCGGSTGSFTTVPLNARGALEDIEKKFKMSDEMRAVVQKVLSNPDLSTFIQTTNSGANSSVPLSPPISPANSVNTPNVTITAQFPSGRQKSVICSTNNLKGIPPSPSTSMSSPSPTRPASRASHIHTHSPSPTTHTNITVRKTQQQQQLDTYNQRQQQQHRITPSMEVIDLSSPRRSMHTASAAYLQQQQQQQQQQVAAAHQQQQQQRMSHQNGGNSINGSSSSVGGNSSRSSSNNSANSASVHLQRHAAMAASSAASVSLDGNRLCVIPEIPISNVSIQPYKVQKVFVDHHLVPCINMKAYTDSDQLMTLTDFRKYFFPSVSLEHCKRLIEALGVELYKGNRRQMQVIQENDRNHTENIPLVQVRDVIKYMTQLTFMIRSQDQQPHSKRVRVS